MERSIQEVSWFSCIRVPVKKRTGVIQVLKVLDGFCRVVWMLPELTKWYAIISKLLYKTHLVWVVVCVCWWLYTIRLSAGPFIRTRALIWYNIPSSQYIKRIVGIKRYYDRLISKMRFPVSIRCHLYTESGPKRLNGDSATLQKLAEPTFIFDRYLRK